MTIDARVPEVIAGDAGAASPDSDQPAGERREIYEHGEVALTVTACDAPGKWHRISFVVRDTGPGIAPEHQQRIFDSFSQVDPSITRKYGGTGLGLAISRTLAEQMGGNLRVESQVGQGAAFSFSILAETAELPKAEAPRTYA